MSLITKILKRFFLATLIAFMVLWLFALMKCEINTNELKDDLPVLEDIHGEHIYNKVKVLYYNNCYACVYACTDDCGNLYHLKKGDSGNWEQYEWECVWSRSGSADSFIFPYIR